MLTNEIKDYNINDLNKLNVFKNNQNYLNEDIIQEEVIHIIYYSQKMN